MRNLIKEILIKEVKKQKDILYNDKIQIEGFINPEDGKKIFLKEFELILGSSSLSIFNYYNTNEIAGLKRTDCEDFLKNNKTERDDAFIAGLTNVYKGNLFLFLNTERMEGLNYKSLITHECLHLTRYLISFYENENINFNKDDWWQDVKFTTLNDENEELFSEVLERCVHVVFNKVESYI